MYLAGQRAAPRMHGSIASFQHASVSGLGFGLWQHVQLSLSDWWHTLPVSGPWWPPAPHFSHGTGDPADQSTPEAFGHGLTQFMQIQQRETLSR